MVATVPPSTLQAAPVTAPARAEHRNTTTSATSWGSARRPSGIFAIWASSASSRLIPRAESKAVEFGRPERGNFRRLRMYIHPEVGPSCLLLMGITDVPEGQVWNTQPPHLHERRMEAYCYFDLAPEDRVFHFMGRPDNTRHLVVADGDVVLSPAWSIHMGAGTGPYGFVWGMTGENQEYGLFVLLEHPEKHQTMYGHLSRIIAVQGARVGAGEVIGRSGNTGRSSAPHLHFEIRVDGQAIDPSTRVQEVR